MITINDNRQTWKTNINFKMLYCQYSCQTFSFNGGVVLSLLLNFLEKQQTGCSTPSLSSCNNTAPAVTSLASTATLNMEPKSGVVNTKALCNMASNSSNAFSFNPGTNWFYLTLSYNMPQISGLHLAKLTFGKIYGQLSSTQSLKELTSR